MRIENLLIRQANNNKEAIKNFNNSITYEEWYRESNNLKEEIENIVNIHSRCIAIYLPNSINYAIAYFGIIFSKKIVIPINSQAKSVEIYSTTKYCEIDLIISESLYKTVFEETFKQYENKVAVYYIDTNEIVQYGEKKWIEKTEELKFDDTDEDVVIMLHTSGTTSNPKRVMLTHKNLICNIESNIASLKIGEEERVMIVLPMCFGYCNTAQFLTHVYLGATIIISEPIFMPKQFFSLIQKEKITSVTAVPTMLLILLEYRYYEKYDISSLKYICFGGGTMPLEKIKEFANRFPSVSLIQTYGQTECSPRVTALLPNDAIRKIGSVGKSIPNVQVGIVDENDNVLGSGEMGEIVVKGKNVMKGYYKNPEATADVLRNGILHTGDIGYLDEEGYLYLTGRIKNIIISGGINIYPGEIELLLRQYKGVKEAKVVGEKHDLLGEVPIAKVVIEERVNLGELQKYCGENLSSYKVPIRFDNVQFLEKTYNGKIKRQKSEI